MKNNRERDKIEPVQLKSQPVMMQQKNPDAGHDCRYSPGNRPGNGRERDDIHAIVTIHNHRLRRWAGETLEIWMAVTSNRQECYMQILSNSKRLICFTFLIVLFASTHALAGPYSDALGKAMVERTTQAEKMALVKWMFVAMSLHPEVKDLSAISDQQREDANRDAAKMFENLLTERCVNEARDAMKYEGASALASAFQILGQVAARELFGHPNVAAGLADLQKHIDSGKIDKVLKLPKPDTSDQQEKQVPAA